ncbi:MAG: enoyl-[acyl-carrier-protein] reductase FabK [Clostridia bacterium]|nr:enoyl-[acyl-carrier-protein] reductase FabK [Clostridia bacterium]
MLYTELCQLLNIEYPIIQGGMAWAATGELAAAVSNAGGLGIIGAGSAPPQVVRQEIIKAKKLTTKPFGVNIYYQSPYVNEVIEVLIAEKVPVVATGGGNPGKDIKRLKLSGAVVIPVVASVALAKRLERSGADALIAEGMECGGHTGDITTMALVPQVVDAVNIPVVAAGGIADGRGLVAALALGASGVQMGTRFLCASECIAHPNYKQAICKAKDRDTVLTGPEGSKVRVIKNKLAQEFLSLEKSSSSREEMERLGMGRLRAAVVDGDIEYGSLMAGQVSGMIKEVLPAATIIANIIEEAETIIKRLQSLEQQVNSQIARQVH